VHPERLGLRRGYYSPKHTRHLMGAGQYSWVRGCRRKRSPGTAKARLNAGAGRERGGEGGKADKK